MDSTHLKEKALHITAHLRIANFSASNGWINRFKWRHNTLQNSIRWDQECDPETVEDWKYYRLLQEIEGYDLCDINNADESSLFFNLQPSKNLTF
jgi:hypothetical protein